MKYSFVIPTYNNVKLLMNSLEALNHLIVPCNVSFEVIVVDDGSSINTYNFICKMHKKYKLKYVYIKRSTTSCRARARNIGIKKAKGEIIVFIDADIIVKPTYLLELERCYKFEKNCIVIGTRILLQKDVLLEEVRDERIFKKNVQITKGACYEFRKDIFEQFSYNASSIKYPCLFCYTCNLAVPKSKIVKCNGFDEDLIKWGIEDVELAYRISKLGTKIFINSRNQVIHQFHGIVEGKYVKEEQVKEVDYNAEIFIKKHKGAFGLNDDEIKELFRSIATRYVELEKKDKKKREQIYIEFDEKSSIKSVCDKISRLAKNERYEVIVLDYNENSDLDLFVQSMSCEKGLLKYYPISCVNKLDKEMLN